MFNDDMNKNERAAEARPEDPKSESWANFQLSRTYKASHDRLYGLDAYCGLNERLTKRNRK